MGSQTHDKALCTLPPVVPRQWTRPRGRGAAALTSSPRTQWRGEARGGQTGLWRKAEECAPEEGRLRKHRSFGRGPGSRPLKTQQRSDRGGMRQPAAQNPFCWHWRPSVRGTLMSHLTLGADSPVPGPGPGPELARASPSPGRPDSRPELGGPSFLPTVTVACAHVPGDRGGQGVRVAGSADASLAAFEDLGQEFPAE